MASAIHNVILSDASAVRNDEKIREHAIDLKNSWNVRVYADSIVSRKQKCWKLI